MEFYWETNFPKALPGLPKREKQPKVGIIQENIQYVKVECWGSRGFYQKSKLLEEESRAEVSRDKKRCPKNRSLQRSATKNKTNMQKSSKVQNRDLFLDRSIQQRFQDEAGVPGLTWIPLAANPFRQKQPKCRPMVKLWSCYVSRCELVFKNRREGFQY